MKQQKSDSKRNKIFYLAKIAALIFGAAIIFSGCENNIEKIKAFSSPENLPIVEATNFKTMFTDSGEVRFSIKAPKLLKFETESQSYAEFPEGIELIKFDEHQNIISSITADYAKQFEKEEKWEAKNNVIATNQKGDTLKTEHLIWEEKQGKVYSKEFVKIISGEDIFTGIGFESDQSLQKWKIIDFKGSVYIDMEEQNNKKTVTPVNSKD